MKLLKLPCLLLMLGLAGCSQWQTLKAVDGYPANAPDTQWTLRGKLGVRHAGDSTSMHLFWQNDRTDFVLRLSAPVGGQQAVITRSEGVVDASLPDGEVYNAATPEALINQLYGWQAPVSSLTWWVRGLPDPHMTGHVVPQDNAQERHWQQGAWSIRWSQYRHFGTTPLPGRIEINGPDALALTVIVQDWQWPTREATP
ncbi:MAG TPA: lipoprotein insertase outer membrane protein LolB [Pseudomonadales bacterium]|jgi:outer membrane lipoprotein LolB